MAGLAHDGSPTRLPPDAIARRMRAAMRLFSQDPQDLCLCGANNLTLLLNARSIDPVFGVHEFFPALAGSLLDSVGTGHSLGKHGFLGKTVPLEIVGLRPVVTGQRLFDDDVLPRPEGRYGNRLVNVPWGANIDDVHGIHQMVECVEGWNLVGGGKRFPALFGFGCDSNDVNRHAVNLAIGFQMKSRG